MKIAIVRMIFVVIELVAALQIVVSCAGPIIWKSTHRELLASVANGGDAAATQFKLVVEQVSRDATGWGAGPACMVLVAALIGSILCRKPKGT